MEKLFHVEGKINCGRNNPAFIARFRTVCKKVKGFCNYTDDQTNLYGDFTEEQFSSLNALLDEFKLKAKFKKSPKKENY